MQRNWSVRFIFGFMVLGLCAFVQPSQIALASQEAKSAHVKIEGMILQDTAASVLDVVIQFPKTRIDLILAGQ